MTLYVNGEKVEDQQIKDEAEKLRPQYEQVFAEMPEDQRETQLMDWSRENVIEAVLMRQAATRDVQAPPAEVVDQALNEMFDQAGGKEKFYENSGLTPDQEQQLKEDISKRLQLEKLIAKITSAVNEPSEKEIKKYYNQNIEKYTIPEMVHAAHIVKHPVPGSDPEKIREEIQGFCDQIKSGTSFEELASKNSDCPENAGDLGFFPRGQMVQEFEDVVFQMNPGDVSDVFQTEFGFHIAKVIEKRDSIPCPLDEVKEVIIKDLTDQAHQRALEKFVDAEKDKAKIENK